MLALVCLKKNNVNLFKCKNFHVHHVALRKTSYPNPSSPTIVNPIYITDLLQMEYPAVCAATAQHANRAMPHYSTIDTVRLLL